MLQGDAGAHARNAKPTKNLLKPTKMTLASMIPSTVLTADALLRWHRAKVPGTGPAEFGAGKHEDVAAAKLLPRGRSAGLLPLKGGLLPLRKTCKQFLPYH